MSDFQELKVDIIVLLQMSRDAIHIHVGLAVFLAAALVARGRASPRWALVAAVLVAMALEVLDLRDDLATRGNMRWAASIHDLVNTTFWPFVLAGLSHLGVVRFAANPFRKGGS